MLTHPKFYAATKQWSTKDIPDCLWPSDNEYGIPLLRLDLQADALDLPVTMWGTVRRSRPMPGTFGFYVDDYRFNHLWKNPTAVMNSGCVNAIEVNFSVGQQTPRAVALHQIYKKRWLARLWQEFSGIRIFVDMNVARQFQEDNLLGVPPGWRSYATRGSTDFLNDLEYEYELACERRGGTDIFFCVYGGNEAVRQLAMRYGWIWLPEQQDISKGKYVAALMEQLNVRQEEWE